MRIIFTVTNDLGYDQRMIRIAGTLATAGYRVTLVGRQGKNSKPLRGRNYQQIRLRCFFNQGKLFYLEYNFRLFFFLLAAKADCICAIDLDTIIPCLLVSKIKRVARVYDAHELFCEMQEIVERPAIYRVWKRIERFAVPSFHHGYTVNQPIANEFFRMYGVNYAVIRNLSSLQPLVIPEKKEPYILYQGAVNEGRCFEMLVPAMEAVPARLIICGDGNFLSQTKALVSKHGLEEKIIFKGMVSPESLRTITLGATIGVTLFNPKGLSNYYSLANRFFDYMHAGVPQVCVDFPVYRELNNPAPFAVLIPDTTKESIADAINSLLHDQDLYNSLQKNCIRAREEYNWQKEEKKLLEFYQTLKNNLG